MRNFVLTVSLFALFAVPVSAGAPADKAVLESLEAWKQAMIKKDRPVLERVLHPDLVYGHSSGKLENKTQAIESALAVAVTREAIDFADTVVRVHGNTALVTGMVDFRHRENGKVTVNKLVVLSVWVKGTHGWQMIGRQATRLSP
jgi:ketosteroid isomerase-like protein